MQSKVYHNYNALHSEQQLEIPDTLLQDGQYFNNVTLLHLQGGPINTIFSLH